MSDSWSRKKSWRERKSVFSVVLIILFVILLTGVIVIWKLRSFVKEKTCATKECVESAFFFLELLDLDADPCGNFYNFTCSNYKGDLVVKNLQNEIDKKIKNFIVGSIDDQDSRSVKLQKQYYQTCMNLTAIEEDQNETIKKLFRELGDWPVLADEKWKETEFNWGNIVEKCKELGLYYDWFMNIEKSGYEQNRLTVAPPDNANNIEVGLRQKYVELMANVARKLGSPNNLTSIQETMKEVVTFETELSKIIAESVTNDTEYSVGDIEDKFPFMPWSSLFKNVVLPKHDSIIFNAEIYVNKLKILLDKTQSRVQANYIFWKLTESFSAFLTYDIRRDFEAFAALSRHYVYPKSRADYCYSITSTVFAYVSEAEYVRQYASDLEYIQEMVTRIKSILYYRLGKAEWMSQSDKSLAFFKLKNMKIIIGGPEEMYDEMEFDKFLGLDKIDLSNLHNTIEILCEVDKIRDKYNLDFVKPSLTMDQARFYQASIYLALTRYLPDENIMFLPAAALDGLFYSNNRPHYLNYGALGTVIGHELSHGFGLEGNTVYQNGNEKILWTNYTNENFFAVAECLLDNCNDIGIDNNLWMNCKTTFEESLADYVGINLSYEAYRRLEQEVGEEKILPGLTYNSAQLFWISYASIMCSNIELNYTEPFTHLLPFQRIIGAYRNTDYFAQDFNCPVGSNMNPPEKCRIL